MLNIFNALTLILDNLLDLVLAVPGFCLGVLPAFLSYTFRTSKKDFLVVLYVMTAVSCAAYGLTQTPPVHHQARSAARSSHATTQASAVRLGTPLASR